MPILHLICGLPGSGKTTLAKKLGHDLPALRLCPDEWMARIVGDGFDDQRRATVEAVEWEIAARVLSLGLDVILENGFWTRADSNDFRTRAKSVDASTKLYYLDVPRDELLRRLAQRNAALPPDTFPIEESQLDEWWSWFEPPTPAELDLWREL